MYIISPTGMEPRGFDDFGSGAFHASRGNRKHNGVDYACVPGQDIYMPVEGKIERIAYPYASDLKWMGCYLTNRYIGIMMFYIRPNHKLIGQHIKQGDIIGKAQNIANKYNTKDKTMTPHVHLQIQWVNPELLRYTV